MGDESKGGIYRKFEVKRTDGSSGPGGKHEYCAYFVLDLEHDPHAIPALRAYAEACRLTHPALADDVDKIVASAYERPIPSKWPNGPSEMARQLMPVDGDE